MQPRLSLPPGSVFGVPSQRPQEPCTDAGEGVERASLPAMAAPNAQFNGV